MRPAPRLLAAGAALLAASLAAPASAQDRPPVYPTRDVSVTYRAEGGAQGSAELRLSWLNAERRMRMDLPGAIGWSVTDTKSGQAFMVNDTQRMVMQLPPGVAGGPGGGPLAPSPTMRFTRGRTETILGQRCTLWRFKDEDAEGEACVTEEGVMLRSRGTSGQDSGSLTATQVSFDRQDPARFAAPAGYRSMTLPTQPGGGPGGGAGNAPRPAAPR